MAELKILISGTEHGENSILAIAKAVEKDVVTPGNCSSHVWWTTQTAAKLIREQLKIIKTLQEDIEDMNSDGRYYCG